jgi:hypothetical protein
MQYEVKIRCVITKIVTCEDCTEEQARDNPWNYATDEHDADVNDWEVKSIKRIDV